MKKWSIILLVLFTSKLLAQPLNNEWIDYSKTYYKFKLGANGLFRINQAALPSDINATSADQFQLWRNGLQVPIYTSVLSGPLGSGGFIEFWAQKNDGKADKDLYLNTAYQLSDKLSLISDTASYFLTINPVTTANLRYTTTANNIAGNSLPAETSFTESLRYNFTEQINKGLASNVGEYVYSSSYDIGEMWSSFDISPGSPRTVTLSNLFPASTGVASFKVSLAGTASNFARTVDVMVNSTTAIANQNISAFDANVYSNTSLPISAFSSGTAAIKINNNSTTTTDRIVCGFFQLDYPKQFNFGGASNYAFSMPATAVGNYLVISGFIFTNPPILYDITNKRRYVADISVAGTVRVVLQASATARDLVLVSQDASNIKLVASLQQRNFINFGITANQGSYLIVSHKVLGLGAGGAVEIYRQYRASAAGGSYNAKTYDIDELTDQFAFGIKKHPLSIKNFLRFARNNFSIAPKFCFLIGKGVTYDYARLADGTPQVEALNLIPTWGFPGSDILLSSNSMDPLIATPIGRLSAINQAEVNIYLDKMKDYEAAQNNTNQSIANKAWMKNMVHVAGAGDPGLNTLLPNYLANYQAIAEDSLMGAKVYPFGKTTTGPVTSINDALLTSLFNNGIGMLTYFGHGSVTTLDYNIAQPYDYNNQGKYPMFLMLGCNVGHMFTLDDARLNSSQTTWSETYVLANQRGGIGAIASSHFGLVGQLDAYASQLYKSFGRTQYNKPITLAMQETNQILFAASQDYFTRLHLEQHNLHGDPALKVNSSALPDYAIEDAQVSISPSFLTVANTSYKVKANFYNLGKAVGKGIVSGTPDSVRVTFKQRYPDNSVAIIYQKNIKPSIRNVDSVEFDIPILPTRDKGSNDLLVSIDDNLIYPEITESNNNVTKNFFVFENDVKPIYPYNFSIVNKQGTKLTASTDNPFAPNAQYVMEMDTTELFNSSFKVIRTATSIGGVVEFDPGAFGADSTVYYWRVAVVPTAGQYKWNNSSFVFINNSSNGFNQSHFFQHTKSIGDRIFIDSATRKWKYKNKLSRIDIRHSIYGYNGANEDGDFHVGIDGVQLMRSACVGKSIIINVLDPVTLKPWFNQAVPGPVQTTIPLVGMFMQSANYCGPQSTTYPSLIGREYNFEYPYWDTSGRRKLKDFLNWIPNGMLVVARLIMDEPFNPQNAYVDVWKNDRNIYGVGNTLYDKLNAAGFNNLDSFNRPRTWAFVYKKNDASFAPITRFSANLYETIIFAFDYASSDTLGYITSPKFGPAVNWKNIVWRGARSEANGDAMNINVVGIKPTGQEDVLFTLNEAQTSQSLASVSAITYPYIKLVMRNADSVNLTPYQLRYWMLTYDPVPEGAIAPNLYFAFKDTLDVGENLNLGVAFKNVSDANFADSLKLKLTITGSNNVTTSFNLPRVKKPLPGDTVKINTSISTAAFTGTNTLYVDVNPDNDVQRVAEQTHVNNFFYKNFTVKGDNIKPLLDVTFDGVHILNGDIVSSKPHITVKLKDESKFLLLTDTAGATITLQYPDNTIRRFRYGTDTLKFTAASSGNTNEALIDFTPTLPLDGEYVLVVKGKDRTGNSTGTVEYRVTFIVNNTPMITNMFNYPNPFTTSTAFVFTLTGSQLPSNIRIQILTITGKVVKEINKDELGPLHIGRNITEYKWDGTDQYGSKLGNGVYLYRVVTNLNGNALDKFATYDSNGDKVNTDKFFKGGYGKMYLMR